MVSAADLEDLFGRAAAKGPATRPPEPDSQQAALPKRPQTPDPVREQEPAHA